ncbi:MAG: CCA tRNA nucleotidyltransferase [Leptospirales bacterium]|nr:CCA tRNA nucleotidyltransferase [Leptospirales bacterium]
MVSSEESGENPVQSHQPELLSSLPAQTQSDVHAIYRRLHELGKECYLVGGAVRDLLMGRKAGDLDFTTNARPDEIIAAFRRTVPTGLQHGTVTVLLGDAAYELTTYRRETIYSDARRPDRIEYADRLQEDLSRRDFTVNALAYEPGEALLLDYHSGLRDLRQRLLRTIGRAEDRFFEDGLRPIRACRFLATLGFRLDSATERALRSSDVQQRSAMVAVERFSEELWKGLRADRPSLMIAELERSGLLYLFFTAEHGRFERSSGAALERLDRCPGAPILRLAMWWEDLGLNPDGAVERLARSLKFSWKQIRDVEWLQRYFQFQKELARRGAYLDDDAVLADLRPELSYQLRSFLSRVRETFRDESGAFLTMAAHYPLHAAPTRLLLAGLEKEALTIRDLKINGADLMALGLSGPQIGNALKMLLDQVLRNQSLNNRQRLLALATGQ